MNMAYPFTWLRIHNNESVSPSSFELRFRKTSRSAALDLECSNRRNVILSDKTLDIHCDLNVTADQVILTGAGVKSLCSLYLSGGRNVALKQNASQTSTYTDKDLRLPPSTSDLAVDGSASRRFEDGSCTHTENQNLPSWSVVLSRPEMVNRYVVYNRDKWQARLKGFVLESFALDGTMVFHFKDAETTPQEIYTFYSTNLTKPVSRVTITAEKMLTLCEVELFSECPARSYGINCKDECSPFCKDQLCDAVTGQCLSCPPGKRGLQCDKDCPTSRHGQDCSGNCSSDCTDQLCDVVTGHCHSCIAGRQGSFCQQVCGYKTYGVGCKTSCSTHCRVDEVAEPAVCHPITGTCLLGCRSGYEGLTCNQEISQLGVGTVIGLDILFLCLLALVVGAVLWYIRYRRKTRGAKPDNYDALDPEQRDGSPRADNYCVTFSQNHNNAPASPGPNQENQENERRGEEEEDEGDTYEEVSEPLMAKTSYDQVPKVPRAVLTSSTVPKQVDRDSYVKPDQEDDEALVYENLDDQTPVRGK